MDPARRGHSRGIHRFLRGLSMDGIAGRAPSSQHQKKSQKKGSRLIPPLLLFSVCRVSTGTWTCFIHSPMWWFGAATVGITVVLRSHMHCIVNCCCHCCCCVLLLVFCSYFRFGDHFEVVVEQTPNNQAYTTDGLPLHTDLPFCEDPYLPPFAQNPPLKHAHVWRALIHRWYRFLGIQMTQPLRTHPIAQSMFPMSIATHQPPIHPGTPVG